MVRNSLFALRAAVLVAIAIVSGTASAYQVTSIKVGGADSAEVQLQASDLPNGLPTPTVKGNHAEIFLPGAELHDSFDGSLHLKNPHALIRNLDASSEKKGVLLKLELGPVGSETLKDRVKLTKDGQGLLLAVAFPTKPSAAITLAQEEQLPVLAESAAVKPAAPAFGMKQVTLILLVFLAAGIATYFCVRFLKLKGKPSGSRKYLIEAIAHCPLGTKTGVSLIRVGREFVLVGVTPNQVNLLSSMPALQAQYAEETEFEREAFKDAVDEEIERLKKEIAL